MELQTELAYPASADRVYQILISSGYREAAAARSPEQQRVLHEIDDGAQQERVVEVAGPGIVPEGIRKLLTLPPLTFRIEETYVHAARAWRWRLRPSQFEKRMMMSGEERIEPSEGGRTSIRHVKLCAEVHLPLMGRRVEKILLESMISSLQSGHVFELEWLQGLGIDEQGTSHNPRD